MSSHLLQRFKRLKVLFPRHYQQIALIMLLGLASIFKACSQEAETYEEKLKQLYSNSVSLLKPDSLKQKLASKDTVYLLDTRSNEEYAVSHLRHAQRIGYDDFEKKAVRHIPKDATVVTYCTVGYRSEKIGERLEALGFDNVYNLYGSMISWVNAGYPVYNQKGKATRKVHTYSEDWSQWLKKGEAVYNE